MSGSLQIVRGLYLGYLSDPLDKIITLVLQLVKQLIRERLYLLGLGCVGQDSFALLCCGLVQLERSVLLGQLVGPCVCQVSLVWLCLVWLLEIVWWAGPLVCGIRGRRPLRVFGAFGAAGWSLSWSLPSLMSMVVHSVAGMFLVLRFP